MIRIRHFHSPLIRKTISFPFTPEELEQMECEGQDNLALERERRRMNPPQITAAMSFLREFLSAGPRPANEVNEAARMARISERTLERARKRLGVKTVQMMSMEEGR